MRIATWNVNSVRTRAERIEGGYRLTGAKTWISNSPRRLCLVGQGQSVPIPSPRKPSAARLPEMGTSVTSRLRMASVLGQRPMALRRPAHHLREPGGSRARQKAESPVWARPSTRAWTSWVPS